LKQFDSLTFQQWIANDLSWSFTVTLPIKNLIPHGIKAGLCCDDDHSLSVMAIVCCMVFRNQDHTNPLFNGEGGAALEHVEHDPEWRAVTVDV
jgi:hypothetical protein